MLTPLERVNNLLADLRFAYVDFDALYAGKNSLTPLESVELLQEQQRLRVLNQNLLRRKRANLPAEKTLDSFDFGFQRSVSREQMLRLSDMTWVEQAFNICFLGPPGVGKTHLALSLPSRALTWVIPLPLKPWTIYDHTQNRRNLQRQQAPFEISP